MEQMKSRWKLGISLLLFGKRRLMRWQEDRLVERHFKAKSNHLHGQGEEKNLRTPLEMSSSLCFLRGKKKYLTDSIREIKDLPIQLAYFSYFRIKMLFLVK